MTLHYRAEGRYSYAVLLFVPATKPFDLFDPARKGRVKLYVRRVFITDDAELLPAYLRFVRGVVDSEDLPLNISREMLQNNPQLAQIRKAVTGRVVGELESSATRTPRASPRSGRPSARCIKEGIYEDFERREKLLALSRFTTTPGENALAQAICRGPQAEPDRDLLSRRRQHRAAEVQSEAGSGRARGIEVLLLTDPVDAFWTTVPLDFEGKPLKSLSQGDVDFGLIPLLDDKQGRGQSRTPTRPRSSPSMKAALGERVSDVRASQRLTVSAVLPGRRQPRPGPRARAAAGAAEPRRRHQADPRDQHAASAGRGDRQATGCRARADLSLLLLEQAQILDGEVPEDPAAFAGRLNRLVLRGVRRAGRHDREERFAAVRLDYRDRDGI